MLAALAITFLLGSLDMVIGTALVALNRERRWFVVLLVAVLANLAANAIVIPASDRALDSSYSDLVAAHVRPGVPSGLAVLVVLEHL